MRFELDEELSAVRELAERIFAGQSSAERVREVADDTGYDAALWRTLGEAGLTGVALPERDGGAGLGMLGLVILLEQQGRRLGQVPLCAAIATAALPVAEFGTAGQRAAWLPGIVAGTALLTGSVEPGVTARREGPGWVLDGELPSVPAAGVADAIVLAADTGDKIRGVFIVPATRSGVELTAVRPTSQESHAAVNLTGVRIGEQEHLSDRRGREVADWMTARTRVALAAVQLGVCSEALRLTAGYTSQREQFGRPLSTNQAVAVRAADAYLDVQSIRLTTHRAAWLLDTADQDGADAAAAVLVAKWWASEGGLRVVHTSQHLHGGIGADIDYPVHRYFLWGRQIAFTLGGANAIAAELGDLLGTPPVSPAGNAVTTG
ncbi:acyl-CoA dehydrogenase [Prauserella marina]|uniref:Acyl-CoA dehydrogenase n=1 Tax=Prauserella marina TaxID=530584 RepID=A0A222VQS6_9PSEU|nr:acyl-CoA dehydrogenase family protein [Prauserella marina]ASR36275.1 acyl-CoA dehydrogenase [Prauserella marina]PWV77050.1 alkylation response protein AidB-like acyl-CoA dehydrogenase [Prauserella marina]SDD03226.1 Acyl-CoA dehydrogenase [Prauserella marina]